MSTTEVVEFMSKLTTIIKVEEKRKCDKNNDGIDKRR
jgi:hypothetical protein